MSTYTIEELLAVNVSREFKNGELGFSGLGTGGRSFAFAVGVPSVATALAHRRGIDFTAQYGVAFEPDIENAPRTSPVAVRGSRRSFCSCVPCWMIM